MAIGFFENTEWSSATYRMSGAVNVNGTGIFLSNSVNFVFQRRIIAYSLIGFYIVLPNSIRHLMEFVNLEVIVEEPANVSANLGLSLSFPVGATEEPFLSNRVTLPGNTNQVSILDIPVKRFNFEISMQDPASAGLDLVTNITFWWETKQIKFVGD